MPRKREPEDQNSERVREIGSARMETVVEELSPMQLDSCKTRITEILNAQDDIKGKLKAAAKLAKDALGDLKSDLDIARSEIATGKRRREIEVQEFLTKRNEVIRIRTDTGEQIGARTARPAELQEPLPLEDGEREASEFDA